MYGIEWRTQFMSDHGEEVRLEANGFANGGYIPHY